MSQWRVRDSKSVTRMSNKRTVNQTLNFLDNLEVSSRASDSKCDGDFQFANIYCRPFGNPNYENRYNDSGDGKMLARNACSLSGNSALLEMNLEETMKSNIVKMNALSFINKHNKTSNLNRWYHAYMATHNAFACKFLACSLNTSKSPIALFEK